MTIFKFQPVGAGLAKIKVITTLSLNQNPPQPRNRHTVGAGLAPCLAKPPVWGQGVKAPCLISRK